MAGKKNSSSWREVRPLGFLVGVILIATGGIIPLVLSGQGTYRRQVSFDRLKVAKIAYADRDLARAEVLHHDIDSHQNGDLNARVLPGHVLLRQWRLSEAKEIMSEVLEEDEADFQATSLLGRAPLEIEGLPLTRAFLQSAKAINTKVEQFETLCSEVTRIAAEVGTEEKLGGQAKVKGASDTRKNLTDSISRYSSQTNAARRRFPMNECSSELEG